MSTKLTAQEIEAQLIPGWVRRSCMVLGYTHLVGVCPTREAYLYQHYDSVWSVGIWNEDIDRTYETAQEAMPIRAQKLLDVRQPGEPQTLAPTA